VDELIVRFLQGQTSPAEERELESWRRSSMAAERRYRELARLWGMTEGIAPVLETEAPSVSEFLTQAKTKKQGLRPQRAAKPKWNLAQLAGWAVAASLVLGMGMGIPHLREGNGEAFGAAEFVTGAHELVTARLSDGSVVRLAPESRLRIMTDARSREVWLDGRAFFAITRDESRPFTVRTRAGDALVLGTRFEVRIDQSDMRVLVVEGRVALAAAGHVVEVKANEASHIGPGAPPRIERVNDVHSMIEWTGPFLVFESTPLREVTREIEHHYGVRIELPDSSLAERTVTAWFADKTVDEVLIVVCRIVGAHCAVRGSLVSIEP
jgi:transmembrane sensor